MRKKLWLCLAIEVILIAIATAALLILRSSGFCEEMLLCILYIFTLAVVNACSTFYMQSVMVEDEEEEEEEQKNTAAPKRSNRIVISNTKNSTKNASSEETDDGVIRGADGKL